MRDPLLLQSAAQRFLDDTVDLKIRITADRRSKMAVVFTCQSEMPAALRRIFRLFHASERQPADHDLFRRTRDLRDQLLNFLRVDLFAPMKQSGRRTN